jgi:hypothetical protein
MPNKMPIIVSHYTVDTGYEKEVENLIASLEKWNLDYIIEPIKSLGTWRANSNYCTRQVRMMLAARGDFDILRVDADAVFQRFPDLFLKDDFKADIAAHIHNFKWCPNELLGGTVFFRNTPEVRRLVDKWVEWSMVEFPLKRNPDLLQQLILSEEFDINFESLPDEYCKIFDLMKEVKEPVIEHFQASRRFKRQVNAKGAREGVQK